MTYWPVEKLLNFLVTMHPPEALSLKLLTLKTLSLIALTSSDRGQTLHAMDVENVDVSNDKLVFIIFTRLKTSKKNAKPKTIECLNYTNPALNVRNYTLRYLERTKSFRTALVEKGIANSSQLFLSWQTRTPITKQTLSRWLKLTLEMAAIDTKEFSGHSYRGAGLSSAAAKGATINQILAAGDWTTEKTFRTFYNKPSNASSVGQMILNHYQGNVGKL